MMNPARRLAACGCAALALTTFLPSVAMAADDYPSRPIRLVLGFPPGGPVDAVARAFGQRLSQVLKVAVVVESKPGANEVVAAEAVTRAAPDGYTMLMGTDTAFSHNKFLFSKLSYDVEAFAPVARVAQVKMTLGIKGSLPVNNIAEFVALMKKDGNKHSYGSSAVGSTTYMGFESFKKSAGFDLLNVPYKGIAPALQDLLGGQVDAMISGGSAFTPYVESGKLKVLAVAGKTRSVNFPNVPTFAEAGYPDVNPGFYIGFALPKGTPKPIVDRLAAGFAEVMKDREFVNQNLVRYDYDPVLEGPAEFAAFLDRDRKISGERIRALGVKLD
ncbi:MAG: tripartite tricarboxylate transporter substrate binding protein [Pseudomonadota bacterium]